jgi:hypothetical protein
MVAALLGAAFLARKIAMVLDRGTSKPAPRPLPIHFDGGRFLA